MRYICTKRYALCTALVSYALNLIKVNFSHVKLEVCTFAYVIHIAKAIAEGYPRPNEGGDLRSLVVPRPPRGWGFSSPSPSLVPPRVRHLIFGMSIEIGNSQGGALKKLF